MRLHIAIAEESWDGLVASLDLDVESAFVVATSIVEDEESTTVLIRQVSPIPADAYVARSRQELVIESRGFMPAFGEAAASGSGIGFIHSHVDGGAHFSPLDDALDRELAPVALLRSEQKYFLSMVVSGGVTDPRFAARITRADGTTASAQVLRVVGPASRVLAGGDSGSPNLERFDRQIRAFGERGQEVLGQLTVGVVGAGGTGSAVCEQLARLGVGRIVVVDDDTVTPSNLTRIIGSGTRDVGRPKVDVVSSSVERIGTDTAVIAVPRRINEISAARALTQCDFIFGCTDDHSGRAVLSRLAYWYLIPVLDVGVVVVADEGTVSDVVARVTFMGPGASCLLCRNRIDPAVIAAEGLPADERERLAVEGYVPGLGEPDPSVVGYTVLVAATAVSEFLHRVMGLQPRVRGTEILLHLIDREERVNDVPGRPTHYCVSRSTWGAGDVEPFLGLVWN